MAHHCCLRRNPAGCTAIRHIPGKRIHIGCKRRFPIPVWRFVHLLVDMPGKRLEAIQQMLAQNPTDSFLLYGLANEYKNEGDFATAIANYRKLIALNPDYVAAYYHCGLAQENAGDTAGAAETYDAGIAIARKIGDSHALSELQAARDILG